MGFADLHIHTTFSDGSYTPEEVVARALRNGVTAIAVCDHNLTAGSLATEPLARAAGLRFVRGVEIDALYTGRDIHLLAYNADFDDAAFVGLLRHERRALDRMSEVLLERMKPDYPALDVGEFLAFPHVPSQGGWKMLHYLKAKGVTGDVKDGARFYPRYGVTYADAGFEPIETVTRVAHDAGATLILAHPGEVFGHAPDEAFMALVEGAVRAGADGVECYYPTHSTEMTNKLLAFCRIRRLKITAGGDCHGVFGNTDIGETRTPERLVSL